MYYALLFFLPILAAAAIVKLYFHWSYTWKEFALQLIPTFFVLIALFTLAGSLQTSDSKIVNGVVTKVESIQKNCQSGWRRTQDGHCTEHRTRSVKIGESCTTSSKGMRSCTPIYATEYKYIYPWERRYYVFTDIPNTYEIKRIDRQGQQVPPRFTEIELEDPVSITANYKNYIKGAADSLFAEEEPVETLPIAYPRVKDYYKINRVIFTGTEISNELFQDWNESFSFVNGNIRDTGANAIIVVTDSKNRDVPEALARNWHAHNINDVVTVIGRIGNVVDWVDVRSWSESSLVNVEIENEIANLGTLDIDRINDIIEKSILDNYEERSMEDFEYLADDIFPPLWAFILAGIILLIITPLITLYFHKNDIA